MNKVLVFKLNNQLYGINIENIDIIVHKSDVTRLPSSPNYVKGIINIRGKINVIFDLKNRLGIKDDKVINSDDIDTGKFIIYNGTRVGFEVDETHYIVECNENQLESYKGSSDIKYILKHENDIITILDYESVLKIKEEC
jgi:purine-binding chemotaxis protein CheW